MQSRVSYLRNAYKAQSDSPKDPRPESDSTVNTSSSVKHDAWHSSDNVLKEESAKNKNTFQSPKLSLNKFKTYCIGFCIGALLAGSGLAVVTTMRIQDLLSSTTGTSLSTSIASTSVTTGMTTTIAPYWVSGTIAGLNPSILSTNGWTECYNSSYNVAMNTSEVATALSQCNKARLLLACRLASATNYTLAAMGLRNDVLYNCSTNQTCTNVANGVGWYFSNVYSWGFVNGTDSVTRNSCDTGTINPTLRLCWHTGGAYGGYRCGSSTIYTATRSVWHAD